VTQAKKEAVVSNRGEQDLNLRGETPFDFESNALDRSAITTGRHQQLR
jgi:hypothetical protein